MRVLPSAELRIAGPGRVHAIDEAASKTSRVTILGFIPDLTAELRTARVVAAPIWSGGGTRIKVLEAMAAARVVVGTSVAVERIGFEHDRHGLVADDPESMAAATLRALRDDAAARRYGANARALAETYRWRTVTSPLEDVYRDLLERRGSVAAGALAASDRTCS
jgi:glycosyltransferase involved in cell wall biosynthesis